jgi:hypothetical protein
MKTIQGILTFLIAITLLMGLQASCLASRSAKEDKSLIAGQRIQNQIDTPIQQQLVDTQKFAIVRFDSSSYHFGSIKKGTILEKEIFLTNLGSVPLTIDQMTACECTTLDYSRLPIPPGTKTPIRIRYDSKDKIGPQIVDIDMIVNTESGYASVKFFLDVKE